MGVIVGEIEVDKVLVDVGFDYVGCWLKVMKVMVYCVKMLMKCIE